MRPFISFVGAAFLSSPAFSASIQSQPASCNSQAPITDESLYASEAVQRLEATVKNACADWGGKMLDTGDYDATPFKFTHTGSMQSVSVETCTSALVAVIRQCLVRDQVLGGSIKAHGVEYKVYQSLVVTRSEPEDVVDSHGLQGRETTPKSKTGTQKAGSKMQGKQSKETQKGTQKSTQKGTQKSTQKGKTVEQPSKTGKQQSSGKQCSANRVKTLQKIAKPAGRTKVPFGTTQVNSKPAPGKGKPVKSKPVPVKGKPVKGKPVPPVKANPAPVARNEAFNESAVFYELEKRASKKPGSVCGEQFDAGDYPEQRELVSSKVIVARYYDFEQCASDSTRNYKTVKEAANDGRKATGYDVEHVVEWQSVTNFLGQKMKEVMGTDWCTMLTTYFMGTQPKKFAITVEGEVWNREEQTFHHHLTHAFPAADFHPEEFVLLEHVANAQVKKHAFGTPDQIFKPTTFAKAKVQKYEAAVTAALYMSDEQIYSVFAIQVTRIGRVLDAMDKKMFTTYQEYKEVVEKYPKYDTNVVGLKSLWLKYMSVQWEEAMDKLGQFILDAEASLSADCDPGKNANNVQSEGCKLYAAVYDGRDEHKEQLSKLEKAPWDRSITDPMEVD